MQRRTFLKGAGVVTILVAGGGVWRADARAFPPRGGAGLPALEGLAQGRPGDGMLPLVRAAILAASPHNTQPWLFKVTDGSIEMYLDARRNLGALDPYLREAHLGMGCALENLILAAVAKGSALWITLVPGKLGPDSRRVRTDCSWPGWKSPPASRNWMSCTKPSRGATPIAPPICRKSRSRPVPRRLERIWPSDEPDVRLFLFTAEADRRRIVAIVRGQRRTLSDPEVIRDNERWLRLDWHEVQEYRDGLTVDAFGLPPGCDRPCQDDAAWMLRRAAAARGEAGLFGPDAERAPDRHHRRA